ncbi:MAG: 3-phosphoshikimate 1-carboxyvinyltransferase [Clostridia bacterium]|nr:3-phosphoshikimate 1-carboxyvinyltransferase [Clostridia bacterium]
MDISMKWEKVSGSENAILSKSDAHRALIAAALCDKPTSFNLSSLSKDIEATLSCLVSLGARVEKNDNSLTLYPTFEKARNPVLDCNECGSTLRFLIPVAAAVAENPCFTGKDGLRKRPLSPLLLEMEKRGCHFSNSFIPFTVSGSLNSGEFTLPGNISSQFISGLLFSLPLLDGDSKIVLSSHLESVAYVDMTIDTLDKFGIHVEKEDGAFIIKGNQKYISPNEYTIEGDWSNIAPFMAAAAMGGEITALGLNPASKQSDKSILSVLEKFGAEIKYENSTYIIKKKNANPIEIDVSQFPDLFPVIAILACTAEGKSRLYNAKRLRIKESDRIESTLALIKSLGGNAEADEDSLTIYGSGSLSGGVCDSFNDHRIVMASAVASVISKTEVIIKNSEAINKSYPGFFTHFKCTGGIYQCHHK